MSTSIEVALQAACCLFVSHGLCCAIVYHLDASGAWDQYALCPKRNTEERNHNYLIGCINFLRDMIFLLIPVLTVCYHFNYDQIVNSNDTFIVSAMKFLAGYIVGKLWAFAVHYALHHKSLYHIHKRHHRNPKNLVASAAWDDSILEYLVMEVPSFVLCLCLFPTHRVVHMLHFALHGWDGACGHSGFKAPGLLGYLLDGEYHYYHHAYLTVNYAELEFLDRLFGTHHSQLQRMKPLMTKRAAS